MQTLSVPQGVFELARYPLEIKDSLRAWDAADEYVLHYLSEQQYPARTQHPLIFNDSFGALGLALADHQPVSVSDSWLSHQGTRYNLQRNQLPASRIQLLSSLQPTPGPVQLAIIKVPKSLALLEYQLLQLRPRLNTKSMVLAAGMSKHIHTSTLQLFEQIVGPTHTSLARKKARLIHCQLDPALVPPADPWPKHYRLESADIDLINHANVFSRERLDIGSRFFLQHIPTLAPVTGTTRRIFDLGCGNGVIGLTAARLNPSAELVFVDESYMAVASAESNFRSACGNQRQAEFSVNDGLAGYAPDSADLILLNPPFHQQHAVGDTTAWRLFQQARKCLKPGAELRIIGNRHLAYSAKLKRLFGNCSVIASNKKFVICSAMKTSQGKNA